MIFQKICPGFMGRFRQISWICDESIGGYQDLLFGSVVLLNPIYLPGLNWG